MRKWGWGYLLYVLSFLSNEKKALSPPKKWKIKRKKYSQTKPKHLIFNILKW